MPRPFAGGRLSAARPSPAAHPYPYAHPRRVVPRPTMSGRKESAKVTSSTTASAPIGLIMIDTVNEVFSGGGQRLATSRRNLSGSAQWTTSGASSSVWDKGFPAFLSPMSHTDEEYDNWKHPSGIHA